MMRNFSEVTYNRLLVQEFCRATCEIGERSRYAGQTGSPDESRSMRRREKTCKAGNARVCRGMIQLA